MEYLTLGNNPNTMGNLSKGIIGAKDSQQNGIIYTKINKS
jgi:hypothetical protein